MDPEAVRGSAISRRRFLGAAAAAAGLVVVGPGLARAVPQGMPPAIRPRSEWGADLPPTGPLGVELPGDVRCLVVHHSASPSDYGADAVPGLLRSFYRLHTGARGWADVSYNFLVDRYGEIWEGRAGSMGQPVMGDATGGSQGFAQLCCFIGDHRHVAPTEAARAAMIGLLGWLADRYGIATDPGSTTTFTSRGTNRWPAGTQVTVRTIAGHRDLSVTACPGDAAYALVRDVFPAAVTAWRSAS